MSLKTKNLHGHGRTGRSGSYGPAHSNLGYLGWTQNPMMSPASFQVESVVEIT